MATDHKGQQLCTTNGQSVEVVRASQTNETGQHAGYITLCPDERAKGFVRPLRRAYRHVGRRDACDNYTRPDGVMGGPCLTCGCSQSEHADPERFRVGGCGTETKMGLALCETYARDPKFYSHTFCVNCNRHLPVNEFVWVEDGAEVGS